jgi:hypothetical protein
MITHPSVFFSRWLVIAAMYHLFAPVKVFQIDAEFPRRHLYRARFWRLVDRVESLSGSFYISEVAGKRIEITHSKFGRWA